MTPKLHIEVVRKSGSVGNSKNISLSVRNELMQKDTLTVGSKITKFGETLTEHIDAIHICELEKIDDNEDDLINGEIECEETVKVNDVAFGLHIYRLGTEGLHTELMDSGAGDRGETSMVAAYYWTLPDAQFYGLWDSLIFDSDIKHRLLRYARTMLSYSEKHVDEKLITSNRVILLHGPPGTGKTTLCKALAQKLSVRMSSMFDHTLLVEINTHSLFSKYFSESGKLVTRMFAKLGEMTEDPGTLVCVLIDEVESLAHSRAAAAHGSEPSDSFRVVNSVLTQLVHQKTHRFRKPNVLVLTTSNITGAIDLAFVDRADIKQLIPVPSTYAIYNIYYSCLQELFRVGMVTGTMPPRLTNKQSLEKALEADTSSSNPQTLLVKLSKESVGLSGRGLRKVPLLAHAFYLNPNRVAGICVFIRAMQQVITSNRQELSPPESL